MTDWFSASIKFQQQIIDAQRASLDAGQKAMGGAQHLIKMQESAQQMAQANLAAVNAWAKLWGIGR